MIVFTLLRLLLVSLPLAYPQSAVHPQSPPHTGTYAVSSASDPEPMPAHPPTG